MIVTTKTKHACATHGLLLAGADFSTTGVIMVTSATGPAGPLDAAWAAVDSVVLNEYKYSRKHQGVNEGRQGYCFQKNQRVQMNEQNLLLIDFRFTIRGRIRVGVSSRRR